MSDNEKPPIKFVDEIPQPPKGEYLSGEQILKFATGRTVRALGFNNRMGTHGDASETLFFIGTQGERIEQATEEQIAEFIDYWTAQIATARLYLANGREAQTTKWRIHKVGVR